VRACVRAYVCVCVCVCVCLCVCVCVYVRVYGGEEEPVSEEGWLLDVLAILYSYAGEHPNRASTLTGRAFEQTLWESGSGARRVPSGPNGNGTVHPPHTLPSTVHPLHTLPSRCYSTHRRARVQTRGADGR